MRPWKGFTLDAFSPFCFDYFHPYPLPPSHAPLRRRLQHLRGGDVAAGCGRGISQGVISQGSAACSRTWACWRSTRRQRDFQQIVRTICLDPRRAAASMAGGRCCSAMRLSGEHRGKFGVPRQILVAIWGWRPISARRHGQTAGISRARTMAHDCRRTELFQTELLSALKIVQRGDLGLAT